MSEEEDSILVDRIRGKDTAALVQYIESKRPQLLAFIDRNLSKALGRKVEPIDILQDVSMSAVGSLSEIDFNERDPFSWLCQLAERRVIDAHRKYVGAQKRSAEREVNAGGPSGGDQPGFIDLLVVSMTSPSGAFSRGQREIRLAEALQLLPEESRTALRLRYVDGLPSRDIAQQLGKTDGATRVLLTRSLAKLQDMLRHDSEFVSFLAPPSTDH
jgi:RNA polymerase sigma-70 factor (ECF subfamily)